MLPSVGTNSVGALDFKTFAALLVGLCTPRPTLRPRSRDRRRTAWGRYGSLDLVSSETLTPYSLPVSPAHLVGFEVPYEDHDELVGVKCVW